MPLHRIPNPLAHPAADFRIGRVRSSGIGVVVKRRIPTISRDLSDAVTALLDVLPESRHVGGIGQNGSRSYSRDRTIDCLFHDDAPIQPCGRLLMTDSQAPWDLRGECGLGCTGVEDVGYKVHVRNNARLCTMNGGQT